MKSLDHPNLIKVYDFFEDERCLVTELVDGGDLLTEIFKRNDKEDFRLRRNPLFSEIETADCIRAILRSLNYLHVHKIMHRDLKPANILLEKNKSFDQLKLIDFGFSHLFD